MYRIVPQSNINASIKQCDGALRTSDIHGRAMHVVLARYCYRKSSVRLSVCDVDVSWAYRFD